MKADAVRCTWPARPLPWPGLFFLAVARHAAARPRPPRSDVCSRRKAKARAGAAAGARDGGRGGGSRHAGDPVCAGHRRAARQRRRQAARRRPDHRGAFKEGDFVNEGDVLFRLDDRMVKAQIGQAEATIARDQAALRDAEATLARRQALIDQQGRHRSRARSGPVCRRGAESQHRRRARQCSTRSARSSTTSPSARRSAAAPAA